MYVGFAGLLSVVALLAAYQLGRMAERPKDKWQKGGLAKFGWDAWRIPLIVLVALAVLINVLWPLLKTAGFGNMFSGMGMGMGMGGGRYAGGGAYGGGMY